VEDRDVTIGIRPEGFVFAEEGPFSLDLNAVEVMGRDKSIVSTHPDSQNATVRSIIPSETEVDRSVEKVRFRLKPAKVFLFDTNTGERIRFEADDDEE